MKHFRCGSHTKVEGELSERLTGRCEERDDGKKMINMEFKGAQVIEKRPVRSAKASKDPQIIWVVIEEATTKRFGATGFSSEDRCRFIDGIATQTLQVPGARDGTRDCGCHMGRATLMAEVE